MVSQPGMRLELEGVRRLVQGQPHAELNARVTERTFGGGDVGLDEVEPSRRHRFATEEREVVLAEDAPAEVAEQESDLDAEGLLIECAQQLRGDSTLRGVSEEVEP